jgi:hypothetical protein
MTRAIGKLRAVIRKTSVREDLPPHRLRKGGGGAATGRPIRVVTRPGRVHTGSPWPSAGCDIRLYPRRTASYRGHGG